MLIFFIAVFVILFLINQNRIEKLMEFRKQDVTYSELPSVENIDRKIIEISKKKNEIENFLFDKNVPVVFIEDIESVSKQNSLNIEIKSVEFIDSDNNLKMDASLIGSFSNIIYFIENINDSKKEIYIDFIRIFRVETEEGFVWKSDIILLGKTK